MGQPEIVFFDLETTGFVNPIRPLQIGAVNSWGNRHFNCSIIPDKYVEPGATNVNGYTTNLQDLFFNYNLVESAVGLEEGLSRFLSWLDGFSSRVVLVGHNCFNYDARILMDNLREFDVYQPNLEGIIEGFSDSFIASKMMYPHLSRHSLGHMADEVLDGRLVTHDAKEDAQCCRSIVRRTAAQNDIRLHNFIFDNRWYRDINFWLNSSDSSEDEDEMSRSPSPMPCYYPSSDSDDWC